MTEPAPAAARGDLSRLDHGAGADAQHARAIRSRVGGITADHDRASLDPAQVQDRQFAVAAIAAQHDGVRARVPLESAPLMATRPDSPGVLTPYPTFASWSAAALDAQLAALVQAHLKAIAAGLRVPDSPAARATTVALPAGWFPLPMMLPLLVSRPPSSMLSEAPGRPCPKQLPRSRIPFGILPADRHLAGCARRGLPDRPAIALHLAAIQDVQRPLPVTPTFTEADLASHSASFR